MGKGMPVERARAYPLVEQGCKAGLGWACYDQGKALQFGLGTLAFLGDAIEKYVAACDLGVSSGCDVAGRLLIESAEEPYLQQGVELLRKGCSSGQFPDLLNCVSLAEYLTEQEERGRARASRKGRQEASRILAGACVEGNRPFNNFDRACRAAQEFCVVEDGELACRAHYAVQQAQCNDGALETCGEVAQLLVSTPSLQSELHALIVSVLNADCNGYATECNVLGYALLKNSAGANLEGIGMRISQLTCKRGDWGNCWAILDHTDDPLQRFPVYEAMCDLSDVSEASDFRRVATGCLGLSDLLLQKRRIAGGSTPQGAAYYARAKRVLQDLCVLDGQDVNCPLLDRVTDGD